MGITTMADLTTSELFAFAQPEDFEKIGGVEKPHYSDATFHDFSSDMEEIEREEAESKMFVLSRGARAERRRRTRNHTAAKRRVFIRIFDLSGDMKNMDERVKRIILKTPDRVQRGWHLESNWWRDEYDRIKARATRKEMIEIRKAYLGVYVEEKPEEKPEELFVQEEISVFDNYMAAFSEEEVEIIAKAAAILGISEEWLFYLSFENEESRKMQAKASA